MVLCWFGNSLILPVGVIPHATQFGGSYLFGKDIGLVSKSRS
jgi:hypothetical protein